MLTNTPKDCELERAALKDIADKKAAEMESAALALEKSRVKAAVALAQAVERESRIEGILAVETRVTALENRVRSSAVVLDTKIVDFDRPLHWLKRNVWTVVSIVVANAAVSALLFRLLR